MISQTAEPGAAVAVAGAEARPRWRSWLRSWLRLAFGRHLMDVSVLLLVILVFSSLREPDHLFTDPDIWWHLADARALATTHHFIRVEPYSFTVAHEPWVNPEWLSEMPFWLGYQALGLPGLYLVMLLGLLANLYLVYGRSRLKGASPTVALWTGILGLGLMYLNATMRTIVFGYIALSVELAILEAAERGQRRLFWLLPPLFAVWINLHGSWIIGFGLLAVYMMSGLRALDIGIFRQEAFSPPERARLLAVLGVSIAALFLNPYGWRLIWNPFDMAFNQRLNITSVGDWQPLNLSWVAGKAAVLAIGLLLAAHTLRGRRWKVYELLFVLFAWYAAFDHARFTFLAAVVAIPVTAADLTRSFARGRDMGTIPAANGLIAALAVGVVVWTFPGRARLEKGLAADFPIQAIASVEPSWRTMNDEVLGGMMDFRARPTFVDTRWDTFEHHGVMKDYLDIIRMHDPLKIFDRYRIDHVLIRQDRPLAYLLERVPGWRLLRREGAGQRQFELFERIVPNPPAQSGR